MVILFALGCSEPTAPQVVEVRELTLRVHDDRVAYERRGACVVRSGVLECFGGPRVLPDVPDGSHRVPLPAEARAVVLSGAHGLAGCVLLESGEVHCWGRFLGFDPGLGGCGRGSSVPMPVAFPGRVERMALDPSYLCVSLEDLTVHCVGTWQAWPREECRGPLRQVRTADGEPLVGVARIGAGWAIDGEGTAFAWEPGDAVAFPDPRLGPVVDLARARDQLCGIDSRGTLLCLGEWPGAPPIAHAVVCGGDTTCLAQSPGGELVQWSQRVRGDPPLGWRHSKIRAVGMSVANEGGCALDKEEQLWCWGLGPRGMGDDLPRLVPPADG